MSSDNLEVQLNTEISWQHMKQWGAREKEIPVDIVEGKRSRQKQCQKWNGCGNEVIFSRKMWDLGSIPESWKEKSWIPV